MESHHLSLVEQDLIQAPVAYQCLAALHAGGLDLADRLLGEFAPVTAIADIRGWVDFCWHAGMLSAGAVDVNGKSRRGCEDSQSWSKKRQDQPIPANACNLIRRPRAADMNHKTF